MLDPGIDPDSGAFRNDMGGENAGRGEEPGRNILGIDPEFDGVTLDAQLAPVIISVSGCSTWSRVFISRK